MGEHRICDRGGSDGNPVCADQTLPGCGIFYTVVLYRLDHDVLHGWDRCRFP